MLTIFRKKKTPPVTHYTAQDRMAKNIVVWCIGLQQRWAVFMQRQMERLSNKGKLIALSLFCLIAGTLSIYFIVSGWINYPSIPIPVSGITTPLHAGRAGDENTKPAIVITSREYKRIENFRRYMDSLARSPSGKLLHDNIRKQRPGLMDSVVLVENMYHLQNK